MPQNNEKVLLKIGSTTFSGWDSGKIKKSIKALAGSFEFKLVDAEQFNTNLITNGDLVEVLISSVSSVETKVLTGYIEEKDRQKDGDTASLVIKGREKTCDLVDCAAIVKSNTWTNASLQKIVTDLCKPFDIDVVMDSNPTKKFKTFTIQPDETVFNIIDRLCRMTATIAITNEDGNVVITNTGAGQTKADNELVLGENLKSLVQKENNKTRFSKYLVKSQTSGEGSIFTVQNTAVKADAEDTDMTRYRPTVIMAEAKSDTSEAQKRANWEAQFRAASSFSYTFTFISWFTEVGGNNLWAFNTLATLIAEAFDVNDEFVISSVEYNISGGDGRGVVGVLENPLIFAPEPLKKTKPKKGLLGT